MQLIDEKGKLFGLFNIIDLSFGIVVFALAFGVLWVKLGHSPINQIVKATGTAEVDVAIRGARVMDPTIFKEGDTAFLTIRNHRYAPVQLLKVKSWRRQIPFLNSKDQVIMQPDPTSPEQLDADITIADKADKTDEGIAMGGHYLKIGSVVELDGYYFLLRGTIMGVRFKETP